MRRRLLLVLPALLAVVLLGTLWALPNLTDWTARRTQLADLASAQIGRTVTLHGPVRLRLLPRPVLEAEGVTLGDPGDSLAFSASALRLRLDGWAMLRGRLVPREVALVGAELRLPWPPAEAVGLPGSLVSLDAQLVNSRVVIGGARLERVQARLTAGGPAQALRADGSFAWNGLEWRFDATVGRPGFDATTPVDLTLALAGAAVTARGVLTEEGRVEGTVEASGPDLSLLMPGPPGPFRVRGRLTVAADLLAADELALDLGGHPARGAVTFRLSPSARLDAAIVSSRLNLDPWVAALRGRVPAMPIGLDLSAEAATFRGVSLRRLRAAVYRDADRLALSDVSALLPGDTEVELNGATAGERLEAAVRVSGTDLRGTLAALGLHPELLAQDRPREGELRGRLVLEASQANLAEFSGTVDGVRVSGAGVLRFGNRPALGLGLNLDRVDLQAWLRPGLRWNAVSRLASGLDANLRISAEAASWGPATLERAALDAALENGRLTLRRLAGRVAEADLVASGTLLLGPTPRVSDATVELSAPSLRPLASLLPGGWPDSTALANDPLSLRATASGASDALQLQATAELGELRAEWNGAVDLPGRRAGGALTLRHPGAPRLLGGALRPGLGDWVGEGSLSLVASLALTPRGVATERFDLVAGGLRANGQLALATDGARPRLSGRVAAETLGLPRIAWRSQDPLPVELLRALDADLALSVERLEAAGLPPLRNAAGRARLEGGRLAMEVAEAGLEGGTLRGELTLDTAGDAPRAALTAGIVNATVTGPLLGLPLDLGAGQVDAELRLEAAGSSLSALTGSLGGEARLTARRGTLLGLDGAAAQAAALAGDEAALRRALEGGATGFEALEVFAGASAGRATIARGAASGDGLSLALRGEVDIARSSVDLVAALRPPEGPELGVRIAGPLPRPRRVPELAPWLRWRAER